MCSLGLILAGLPGTVCAARLDPVQWTLASAIAKTPPGSTVPFQLTAKIDPGWHIYWQNAGDSGEPPKVVWNLPAGYSARPIEWPAPKRLGSGSIIDYGYEDQVLLVVPIRAPMSFDYEGRQDVQIVADVNYIVCREVCVPGKAHLALSLLNTNAVQAREWHGLFDQARKQLPEPAPAAWKISARAVQNNLVLSVAAAPQPKSAEFFPRAANIIENSAPQLLATDRDGFHLTLKVSDQASGQPTRLKGVLVLDGVRAYQIAMRVASK